ncbi:class A beta-lactamase [Streptomyces tubbatahanensis]|uniref:Beta-lactamase n=1 Tax=Streptomyces tubbatahanensis TaxID=2923272 RepID=A0ABY3XNX6_9ACTN|nr:class A beta-lactamase [Streptomyces tubbatahanensis]UNS96119.1 class A beta-lactamase [Streptomyces tubbatahanensis]
MRTTTARRTSFAALGTLALVLPLTACGESAATASAATSTTAPSSSASAPEKGGAAAAFKKLEAEYGARLGVHALDTGSGRAVSYHADERFAYASTHKAFTAAAILDTYSLKGLDDKSLTVGKDVPVGHSPVTSEHVGQQLTLRELCEAAVRQSDNGADNLLVRDLGGPKKLDAYLEGLGDDVTQMNRYETALTEATPGDKRDTTTPRAFAEDLRAVTLGDALHEPERAQLDDWLDESPTGTGLIRAGVPKEWSVGDKSGAARYGTRNDIAVVRPPGKAPLIVTVMSKRKKEDADYDDKLVAEAASVVADKLS